MVMKLIIGIIIMTSTSISYGYSLSEIKQLSYDICDKLSTRGTIERTEVIASLHGKGKALLKLIGGEINLNGSVKINNTEYDGLPYKMLPEQMTSARNCRKELASMLIMQTHKISEIKQKNAIQSEYHVEKNGDHVYLMKNPNFKSFINYQSQEDKIVLLIQNTKLALLSDKYIESNENTAGIPITWRKVRLTSGEHSGKEGWVPQTNIAQD
mgnify:CR=1 FL=1